MNFRVYNIPAEEGIHGGQVFNWLRVTPDEALDIIRTLSHQALTMDPNTHRAEYTTDTGEYLTIAVLEEKFLNEIRDEDG